MFTIEGNKIYLTRGDTAEILVSLTQQNGATYKVMDGDVLYFRVKKYPTNDTSEILIEKTADVSDDEVSFTLEPSDTIGMPFGVYSYEVELVMDAEEHYTVVADTEFIVGKELENHE